MCFPTIQAAARAVNAALTGKDPHGKVGSTTQMRIPTSLGAGARPVKEDTAEMKTRAAVLVVITMLIIARSWPSLIAADEASL